MTAPVWVTAFLDLPASDHPAGTAFWAAVTGSSVSDSRGDDGEFATLLPPDGDAYLRVQRLGDGPARVHLDLHATGVDGVDDVAALAGRAEALGAQPLADRGHRVLASPSGVVFCVVGAPAAVRPQPVAWPGGRSLLDQVCLDLGPDDHVAECAFWCELTGWPLVERVGSEFASLDRPAGQPLRFLLQRLDDQRPAGVHLDLASDDRAAEVARHEALGAVVERVHDHFTVLRDPAGSAYCVTDRSVDTGLLGT